MFLAISFRLLDLCVRPATRPLMILPPWVQRGWSPVHGPLHVAKVRPAALAGAVAAPPVLPVDVNLIVEAVVDLMKAKNK